MTVNLATLHPDVDRKLWYFQSQLPLQLVCLGHRHRQPALKLYRARRKQCRLFRIPLQAQTQVCSKPGEALQHC